MDYVFLRQLRVLTYQLETLIVENFVLDTQLDELNLQGNVDPVRFSDLKKRIFEIAKEKRTLQFKLKEAIGKYFTMN